MIVKRKMRKIEGFWFFFCEFPRKNTGASPCERSRSQRRCSHSTGVRLGVFQQALASHQLLKSRLPGLHRAAPGGPISGRNTFGLLRSWLYLSRNRCFQPRQDRGPVFVFYRKCGQKRTQVGLAGVWQVRSRAALAYDAHKPRLTTSVGRQRSLSRRPSVPHHG